VARPPRPGFQPSGVCRTGARLAMRV